MCFFIADFQYKGAFAMDSEIQFRCMSYRRLCRSVNSKMGKLRQWFYKWFDRQVEKLAKTSKQDFFCNIKVKKMTQYDEKELELQKQILKAEGIKIHQKIFMHIV